jgi:proline iminopeptidase
MSPETPQTQPGTPVSPHAGWLDVGHGHRIYHEQAGTPEGVAVLLLHGGPGSSSTARQREPFDPARYRIIQFDQRGCGRSTPLGETAHNHTDALIEDIEMLRRHLGIDRWLVAGGSWGAALALAYAARNGERVSGLLLRGSFLTSHDDLDWFFHGVAAFAPQAQAEFMALVPPRWRRRVVTYLDRCFASADAHDPRALRLANGWQAYESRLDQLHSAPASGAVDADATRRLLAKYRVQAHYLARRCFLGEAALLRACTALRGVPVALVHGTHDYVCRPSNAWQLHRACAGSRLAWADQAGHHPRHPATSALLREAADGFAATADFSQWPRASTQAAA